MAAPRIIFLARHGETEWNRIGRWQGATDIPLSDTGRLQARGLAERVRGQGIARVYASHLSRARETAEIVAAELGLTGPVIIDPRLRERGYGCFEGLTRDECSVRFPGLWERYEADRRIVPPDAEPQDEIVARVTAAMRDIALAVDLPGQRQGHQEGQGPGPALVVSHGGTIRSFMHATLGILPPPLGNGAAFRLTFTDGAFVAAAEF